jgi:CDP-diacylglycerol--glycerol-3-phosphate 3-phosphatidyltransferase
MEKPDNLMVQRYFTLANLMSAARAFMAIPIVLLLNNWDGVLANFPLWAVFWISLAVLSDFLDGWFARSYKEITWVGKILDPIADKIVIFSVLFFAQPVAERIPTWFLVYVILREAIIVAVGYSVNRTKRHDIGANRTGKWSIIFLVVTLLLMIFQLEPWADYFMYITVLLGTLSMVFYLQQDYRYYRQDRQANA